MSTRHEVICDSFSEEAETEIFTVTVKVKATLGKKSVPALTSRVGIGTSDGAPVSAFLVKAGYTGTHCDLAMAKFALHHRKPLLDTLECEATASDFTSVIGGLVTDVTD